MPKISALPSMTAPDTADPAPVVDDSVTITKKLTLGGLRDWLYGLVNIPAGPASPVTRDSEHFFDHVASGLVISGDSYGSNRNASMTSGICYINGRRISISSVTARSYTASKDTYVDVLDNLDGTGTLVYTEVTNNAASPALASNSIRIGIVVTGASSIAAATSVNQGQETALLPTSDSGTVYVMVVDTLGNMICSRDPNRKVLAYRQVTANQSTTSTSAVQATGLKLLAKIPTGRKVKVSAGSAFLYNGTSGSRANLGIYETSVAGTMICEAHGVNVNSSSAQNGYTERTYTPSSANPTYVVGLAANSGGTATMEAYANNPAFLKVELA